ncbi:MAG: endolytic transglycosylase MltG, partial [Clostridiales bacterium]|nr:endolytic transglycosylase MltG [Clostridiales bacterium]
MQRDTRKRRPEEPERRGTTQSRKKKKRSSMSSSMVYIVTVCAISMVLAAVGWSLANDMLALNKENTTATIVVEDENDFGSVVDQLKDNDIINYKGLFTLFCVFSGSTDKIAQGTYVLDSDMDYRAIINSLGASSANRKAVTVTIPEGLTVKQTFQMLEEQGVSTVEKLNDMAANHDYAFSFLQDIPLGDPNRLEGYLFP